MCDKIISIYKLHLLAFSKFSIAFYSQHLDQNHDKQLKVKKRLVSEPFELIFSYHIRNILIYSYCVLS